MNMIQFLEDLTRVGEIHPLDAPATTRRDTLGRIGRAAVDFSKVALPFGAAFAAAAPGAQAQGTTRTAVDVFNFALLLEYLEAEFYERGLAASGLVTGTDRDVIALIGAHETAHVEFLRQTISANGGRPVDRPEFDFTAGSTFADVFRNPATFLAVAQAFEDTGVRAYKGQARFLVGAGELLTAALRIHSVEARHAAMIRRLREQSPWVPLADGVGSADPTYRVYGGEENVTQLGVDASAAPFSGGVSLEQATEAYDEPLSTEQANAIAALFMV